MLNNLCLQGNLGAAPELKTSPSGISSVSFRIAVKRNYKESDGNYKTDWFSCVAFRHTAEFICNHFGKGGYDPVPVRKKKRRRTQKEKGSLCQAKHTEL